MLCASFSAFAQQDIKGMLKFADEQFQKADYYNAIKTYEEVISLDSSELQIHWKYAESLRFYKDYEKAEKEYKYIQLYDSLQLFPNSLLYLGLMQKQNGKYDDALETFKNAKKKYTKDRKSYPYVKSKQEIESCLWAKSEIKNSSSLTIEQLEPKINSTNSEFGGVFHQNHFYFTSLRADSFKLEEVYDPIYTTSIYKSEIKANNYVSVDTLSLKKQKKENIGNGSFSLDGKRFYYSSCEPNNSIYQCVIMISKKIGDNWSTGDTLGEIINAPNSNTTMPQITLFENEETLFFVSDREGTKGGLDIWYSTIKNGNQYGKVRAVKAVNSIENDVTPWYDTVKKRLYFSSTWYENLGGFDVFYSSFDGQFQKPLNAGQPINSSVNDLYYFAVRDTLYFSSNRIGVYHTSVPTCCSDIFRGFIKPIPTDSIIINTENETLTQLMNRLPVTLYFHNDIPNPKSIATTTSDNYIDTYRHYSLMLDKYKQEYSLGLNYELAEEAKEDISDFFIEYIEQGVKDLEQFRDLLLIELKKGKQFNLYIKGFASPLAKSDYNVNLTKRRIGSLINYLNEYENGVFKPYIDGKAKNGGKLIFNEIPFGENVANKLTSDNPNDTKNSIYSRAAAIERKIEIQSIEIIEKKEEGLLTLTTKNKLNNLGTIKKNEIIETFYTITNTSDQLIEIENIEIPCDCNQVEIDKKTINPGETINVKLVFDPSNYSGEVVKSIYIKVKNQKEKLRLIMTGTIQ